MTAATGRMDTAAYGPRPGPDWTFGVQWKSVVAAALVGFAITLILTTLGAAIGFTASDAANGADATAVGVGALIWWTLTVAIAGFLSGRVLATTARRDLDYRPMIYGTLAWVLGVIVLLFLLANGVGNVIGGLGGGMGAAAATATPSQQGFAPADSARMMETAATVGTGATWGLLVSQLIGLGATIVGAGRREVVAAPREYETTARTR
ncbi:MAG: hypothetical protein ACREME_08820 [Gemmatimonadales bacterium]